MNEGKQKERKREGKMDKFKKKEGINIAKKNKKKKLRNKMEERGGQYAKEKKLKKIS